MDEFDIVIVGAGSAGCVLAERLSADGRRSILVIEAGGHDRRFWIKTPIGYGKCFTEPAINWRFTTAPIPGLGGRADYWPRGKVLGGSSSINAMVYCRGLPSDFDDWRAAGNPGWGWDDVEPVFRRMERRISEGGASGEGPVWVSNRIGEYHPIKRHFLAAAAELGLPLTPPTEPDAEGIGGYWITTRNGLRWSAADAFLRPALKRRNVELLTGAAVERVLIENRRARGVVVRVDGAVRTVRARQMVVLSAGAVASPKLLQLSGIGPGAALSDLGIPVVHDNPHVGANLQDHLGVNYHFRSREHTLNRDLGTWAGRLVSGLKFLAMRSGPLSLSVNQMGGLVRTSGALPRPDTQLYFNPLSYSKTYVDKRLLLRPDPFPGFIVGFNSCRPTSTGRIDCVSPDPSVQPRIEPNYLSTNQDLVDVVASARLIGRIAGTTAMQRLIDGAPRFDIAAASDEAIIDDFRARASTVFHPCGTCRMAPEDQGGVVDSDLKVHGVDGLRIVDASVFPNMTSANINAPTLMTAYKAADHLMRDA